VSKKRFVDNDSILQVLAVVLDKRMDLSSKDLRLLALEMKSEGISDELKTKILKACDYLDSAYINQEKFLKKTHIPMLVQQAIKAMDNNTPAPIFRQWSRNFFNDLKPNSKYQVASDKSVSHYKNVVIRIEEMTKHFDKNINGVVVSEEEDFRRGKGRPKKEITVE